MIKSLADSGLFNEEDLAKASAAMLDEHTIMPSFEFTAVHETEEDET